MEELDVEDVDVLLALDAEEVCCEELEAGVLDDTELCELGAEELLLLLKQN